MINNMSYINVSNADFQQVIIEDQNNGYVYICKSGIGAKRTDKKWSIARIDSNGNKCYPIGPNGQPTSDFIFSVDEAENLTYFNL